MKPFRTLPIVAAAAFGTLAATAVVAEVVELPDAPGKAEILETCVQCHGVDVIVGQRRSPDEWSQVVSRMVGNGASLTDEQYQTVLAYLSTNFAPAEPATAGAPAPADQAHAAH